MTNENPRPGASVNGPANSAADNPAGHPSDTVAAAAMAGLFQRALADEPQSAVTSLSVLAAARAESTSRRGPTMAKRRRAPWLVGVAAAAAIGVGVLVVVPQLGSGGSTTVAGSAGQAAANDYSVPAVAGSATAGSTAAGSTAAASATAASTAAEPPQPESAGAGAAAAPTYGAGSQSAPAPRSYADQPPQDASGAVRSAGEVPARPTAIRPGPGAAAAGGNDTGGNDTGGNDTGAESPVGETCTWNELGADAVAAARSALPSGMVDRAAPLTAACPAGRVGAAVLVPAGGGRGGITVRVTRDAPGACLLPAAGVAPCVSLGAGAPSGAYTSGPDQVFVYDRGLQARLDVTPAPTGAPPDTAALAAAGRAVLDTLG